MNKIIILLLIFLTSLALKSQTNEQIVFDEPKDYATFIYDFHALIEAEIIKVFDLVNDTSATKSMVLDQMEIARSLIKSVIENLEKVKFFKEDFGLLVYAIRLFNFHKRTMEGHYIHVVNLAFKDTIDYNAVDSIMEIIVVESDKYEMYYRNSLDRFVEHYNKKDVEDK